MLAISLFFFLLLQIQRNRPHLLHSLLLRTRVRAMEAEVEEEENPKHTQSLSLPRVQQESARERKGSRSQPVALIATLPMEVRRKWERQGWNRWGGVGVHRFGVQVLVVSSFVQVLLG